MKRRTLVLASMFVLFVFGVSMVLASIGRPPTDGERIEENMRQLSECRGNVGECIGIFAACHRLPFEHDEGHHEHSCRECIEGASVYFAAQEACRQHNVCLSQRNHPRNPCTDAAEQELRERCESALQACLNVWAERDGEGEEEGGEEGIGIEE